MSALLAFEAARVDLGGRAAVEAASLRVGAGERVALLGPNGAGKTTLLRAGIGLIALSAGSARLGGDDPAHLSPTARARRAAYLPQRPSAIWPVSVARLVALGRYAYGAAPDRLSAADQAAVDAALAACGLEPLRARRMDQLSGGEKARAHLARALAQGAPLLLLDEADAGLDPAQALGVADILRAHAAKGGAALFSTHDVALAARAADRVVLMRAGRILAEGSPREALSPGNLEAAYGRKGRLVESDGAVAAVFE